MLGFRIASMVVLLTFFGCLPLGLLYAQETTAPMSLQDIVRYAHQNNPELKGAYARLKEAKELYPQAVAGWRPTASVDASVYASNIENSNFRAADGATTKELGLNLEQPIWQGGKTFAEVDRAKTIIRAEEFLFQQQVQRVLYDVLARYIELLKREKLLELRIKNVDLLTQEFSAAKDRREIGDITETDLQQAKVRLSRAQAEQAQAQTRVDIAGLQFKEVVGLDAPQDLMLPHPQFAFPKNAQKIKDYALNNNPEIQSAILQYKAAGHSVDSVFSELLPQVNAFASINKQYSPQPGIVDESSTETIGLRASLALYQGGHTRSRLKEARIAKERREYEIRDIKNRIEQEALHNWYNYKLAVNLTEGGYQEIAAAQFALDGVRVEAAEGQRRILDVLDADQELIEAKSALVDAQTNEALSQYALAKSLGLLNINQFIQVGRAEHPEQEL